MPKQQRGLIVKQILLKGPTRNVLVWGVGGDSIIWNTVNQGHTLFIEHDPRWARKIAEQVDGININVITHFPIEEIDPDIGKQVEHNEDYRAIMTRLGYRTPTAANGAGNS